MATLHVVPGRSAGGSLRKAIRDAGRHEEVLRCPDDLSCGPIDSDDPSSARAAWWTRFYDWPEFESDSRTFWDRVTTSDDRLVVWFGRRCASELAFFLALADRLGDRSYDIVDVTGMQWPVTRPDGSTAMTPPEQAVGVVAEQHLGTLLGQERPITREERAEARSHWRRLRSENAPFRIVTPTDLASAPADHFDALLLERAAPEWQKMARLVGDVMGYDCEPYIQVGDLMLLTRAVALIDEGKLLADGDLWDMRACRVRLPG